jgi:hypothetical protein
MPFYGTKRPGWTGGRYAPAAVQSITRVPTRRSTRSAAALSPPVSCTGTAVAVSVAGYRYTRPGTPAKGCATVYET